MIILRFGYSKNTTLGENLKCLDAGMDDYITKPISLRSVEGILKKHLLSDDFLI